MFHLQTSLSEQQQQQQLRDSRNSRYARIQSDASSTASGMHVRENLQPDLRGEKKSTPVCVFVCGEVYSVSGFRDITHMHSL